MRKIKLVSTILVLGLLFVGCGQKSTNVDAVKTDMAVSQEQNIADTEKVDDANSNAVVTSDEKQENADKAYNAYIAKMIEDKTDEESNTIKYENKKLGFTLNFTKDWEGRYEIKEFLDDNKQAKGIEIYYLAINNKNFQSDIPKSEKPLFFTISALSREEALIHYYNGTAILGDHKHKIGTAKGKDYYYIAPTDEPAGAFNTDSIDYKTMTRLVEEQSDVAHTFKAIK